MFSVRKGTYYNQYKESKVKVRNPVPLKWVCKSKEYPDRIIRLESINIVKGYMKIPVVYYT